jgi:hypothetical protein
MANVVPLWRVWGFKSSKAIADGEYPQVKDSNKCPEGDLNPHAR